MVEDFEQVMKEKKKLKNTPYCFVCGNSRVGVTMGNYRAMDCFWALKNKENN